MQYLLLITISLLMSSCGIFKTTQNDHNIIYKNKIEDINSELSVVIIDANNLACNTQSKIDLRLNGQSSRNLVVNAKGCVVTKEGMHWGLKPVCNKNTTKHSMTILYREESGNLKELVTIDLTVVL